MFTCRLEAPIARNRASSRLRCATRIENVLMIRNVPTTIATPANTRRKVLMNPSTWAIDCWVSWATLSPVWACAPGGRMR